MLYEYSDDEKITAKRMSADLVVNRQKYIPSDDCVILSKVHKNYFLKVSVSL